MHRLPVSLQSLLIQCAALVLAALLFWGLARVAGIAIPLPGFALIQGMLAAALSHRLGQPAWWWGLHLGFLPAAWLAEAGLTETDLANPARRDDVARLALRLVELARPYRASARVGATRLAYRSRLAVLAADGIYGTIGEKVAAQGSHAWDQRVRVSGAGKLALLGQALLRSAGNPPPASRDGLWTRPRAG